MRTEAQKRATAKWRMKNRERLLQYDKDRNKLRKEYLRRKNDESEKRCKQYLETHLGSECKICHEKWIDNGKRCFLHYHNILGLKHSTSPFYIKNHIGEFVRLCNNCHKHVHWNMRYLNISWNEIKERLSTV